MTHETGTLEPEGVRTMFDRIAPFYDVMNHVMTVGLDRRWRRQTVQAVVQPGARVLDACCGTGDLAIAAEREGGIVTGLDFSGEMLVRARRKSDTIEWVQGDVLALPYSDASFDAATVGFGVRNVADLGDEARVPGHRAVEQLLDLPEVLGEARCGPDDVERGAHRAVAVWRATIEPPKSRNCVPSKPHSSISTARSSAPGNRRTLAGRYV